VKQPEENKEESDLNEGEAIKKEIKDLEDKIQKDVQEAKDEIDKMNKQIEEYKSANVNDFIIDAAQKVLPSLDYRVVWQESQNAIIRKK
jgi:molecular chaperone GrpE (heat shock protein)